MYRALFALAGLAIFGWMLLIFLPGWKVTRRIADSAVFPFYLSILYAVGVFAALRETGPGIMADFVTADGVLKILRMESVALVAWIHILVFDQVVAHLIYRDNMKYRFIPLPVQSVLLLVTLMFPPLGFFIYWLIRVTRTRSLVAWGERADAVLDPDARPVHFGEVVTERSVIAAVIGLLRREPALVRMAALGVGLALVACVIALSYGGWLLGTEGRLKEAARFDIAIPIFMLTMAMLLPLSGMSASASKRWRRCLIGFIAYGYALENIQAWRGIDPRFSRIGTPLDQLAGTVFFLQALGVLVLFIGLTGRFFRDDALSDHPTLRTALRYGALGANFAFFVGVLMSGLQGRFVHGSGDLMAIHAAGFHGLQAVPLVALLLGWSGASRGAARTCIHAAGIGWLLFSAGLFVQAFMGIPTLAPGLGSSLALAGAALWLMAFGYAWWVLRSAPALVAAR
jgi:hypothetical protein